MAFVVIVGLVTAVIALGLIVSSQSKSIQKYEEELITKAKKGKK